MIRMKRMIWVALILSGVVSYAVPAIAQDEYQSDIKPGLNIHAQQGGPSLLSQAARDGVSVVISEDGEKASGRRTDPQMETYNVKDGDTLWDICTRFFSDPYVWPRIWSYNNKITNPHWIYPGDMLWLVPPRAVPAAISMSSAPAAAVAQPRPKAILVRNRGFVDTETLKQSGTLIGSREEMMMLSQYDEAYVQFPDAREIRAGDEFSIFEVLRDVDSIEDPGSEMGKLVEILGVVRVTQYDRNKDLAKVIIDESFRPIERGSMVGPVHRRFDLVSPVVNEQELKGYVIAFLDPGIIAAAHNIVFVDKGSEQGVKVGNRFFVVEKRDNYRKSLDEEDNDEGYPFEVLAEMRVIEARPNTSTCIVTATVQELMVGVQVEMVKGY